METPRPLYIIRHAVAQERGDKWPDDSKRPLTPDGAAKMRGVADGLLSLDVELDVVLTSPFVRASQTAEIVAKAFKAKPQIVPLQVLEPGGTAAKVAQALAPYAKAKGVALVGHEPDLGE